MTNPYEHLPPRSFWKTAVAGSNPGDYAGLWQPKFGISRTSRIATAGSCFAQHIGRRLKLAGYGWVDSEPAPHGLPWVEQARHGYGVFSFRTGNIYTARLFRHWVEAALGIVTLPPEVWEQDGRFHDPFRPAIEPRGYGSAAECLHARAYTLDRIRDALGNIDVMIFTLGLTEAWRNRETGFFYPACPGTLAGEFDAAAHEFHNLSLEEIVEDLGIAFGYIRAINPEARFLLTVSPVPLTATASADHVLLATTYSKAVLRAAAGMLTKADPGVDYFPSYEIVASPPSHADFFDANLRTVGGVGVDKVMDAFFDGLGADSQHTPAAAPAQKQDDGEDRDVVCEEALLDAFAPGVGKS